MDKTANSSLTGLNTPIIASDCGDNHQLVQASMPSSYRRSRPSRREKIRSSKTSTSKALSPRSDSTDSSTSLGDMAFSQTGTWNSHLNCVAKDTSSWPELSKSSKSQSEPSNFLPSGSQLNSVPSSSHIQAVGGGNVNMNHNHPIPAARPLSRPSPYTSFGMPRNCYGNPMATLPHPSQIGAATVEARLNGGLPPPLGVFLPFNPMGSPHCTDFHSHGALGRGFIPSLQPNAPPSDSRLPYGRGVGCTGTHNGLMPDYPTMINAMAPHQVMPPLSNPNLPPMLVKQIDYYFSDSNLVKDEFLRSNMDDQGWVPVSLIATFPRVREMTTNIHLILTSLKNSSLVEVKDCKIRRREGWMKWISLSSFYVQNHGSSSVGGIESSMKKATLKDVMKENRRENLPEHSPPSVSDKCLSSEALCESPTCNGDMSK